MLTQEIVRELLNYDPETGKLTWRRRDRKWFKSNQNYSMWNNKFAGKEAFTYLNKIGYYESTILGKFYHAHKIIMIYQIGEWVGEIDHINHDRKDNRWSNLRVVSHKENQRNQSMFRNNTSGYVGVHWNKGMKKWVAQIKIDEKQIPIGRFDLKEDAIAARKKVELEYNFHENHGVKP